MVLPDKDTQQPYSHDTAVEWLRGAGFSCTADGHEGHKDQFSLCSSSEGSVVIHVPKAGKAAPFMVEHEVGPYKDHCVTAPVLLQFSPRRSEKGRTHINVSNPLGGHCSIQVKREFAFKKKYLIP